MDLASGQTTSCKKPQSLLVHFSNVHDFAVTLPAWSEEKRTTACSPVCQDEDKNYQQGGYHGNSAQSELKHNSDIQQNSMSSGCYCNSSKLHWIVRSNLTVTRLVYQPHFSCVCKLSGSQSPAEPAWDKSKWRTVPHVRSRKKPFVVRTLNANSSSLHLQNFLCESDKYLLSSVRKEFVEMVSFAAELQAFLKRPLT